MAREMKESGVEWIRQIPKDWKILKNKNCFTLRKEIVGNNFDEYNLLSLTKLGIKIKDKNDFKGKVPENYGTYQNVKKGELVLCLFDLDCSAVFSGLSEYEGMISPAYKVYNCNENIFNNFAKYWFEYCFIERKYKIYSKSLRYVVNSDDFGGIEILVPPLEEQEKIANYLDKKVSDIDLIIEKTKATIEDYKKYKQSIITEAVTKGINPNVEMKDSGIEWIGEIPKHWGNKRLKQISYIRARLGWKGLKAEEYTQEGYMFLSAFNIINSKLDFTETNFINSYRYEESPEIKLKVGDVLIVKDGAGIGKCAYVEYLPNEATINGSIALISTNEELKGKFLYYYFLTKIMQKYVDRLKDGMGVPHLFQKDIKEIRICIPPLEEQNQIAEYLDKKTFEIDTLITKKEALIAELEEYKKSLIYECVTGKKEIITSKIIPIEVKQQNFKFKKAVLVAKIMDTLEGKKGIVAIAKILYLLETHLQLGLNANIKREAAGPLDNEFYETIRIIIHNRWFKEKRFKEAKLYIAAEKKEGYKKYYLKYFSHTNNKIEDLMKQLKKYETEELEKIATMYASINDFKINGKEILEEKIIDDIYSWNDTKKRFSIKEWETTFGEVKKLDLIPVGYGNETIKKY